MRIPCIFLWLLFAATAFSQQKTKPKQKAPTQKEMNATMKEMEAMMGEMMSEMSDEDKKMMDSMGIKMPDLKKIKMPAMSDKQLAEVWEDEQRIVPKKDQARISSIPKVTDARLPAYIKATHQKVSAKLDPKIISAGDAVYSKIQSMAQSKQQAGNMALGFWVSGQPDLTVYLLGKICSEDLSQADNLSNYAAALTMSGGEQLAIPILQSLNTKFRGNSTILNNLGQAWYGLGEISKSEKYLDSVIAIYPYHPQANFTKASIEESKGNNAKAVEHAKKAIRHSYTKEREAKLNELGYKLARKDLRIPFSPGSDPMGLEQTRRPDYPTSIAKINALLPAWKDFNKECDKKIENIQAEIRSLTVKHAEQTMKMASTAMATINNGGLPVISLHPLMRKASLAAQERVRYYEQAMKKLVGKYESLLQDLDAIRKKRRIAAPEAPCSVHRDNINKLLEELNSRQKIYDDEALHLFRLYCNDMVYWAQFTSVDPISFRLIQLEFQLFWLNKNRELQPLEMETYVNAYKDCEEKEDGKPGKLSEFDDVACNYRTKINFITVEYDMNCSHTIITYHSAYQTVIEKHIGNKYVGGTIKTHISVTASDKIGPVGIEGTIGFNVDQQLDENKNVKDWNGTANAGVEVSAGISEGPVKLGGKLGEEMVVEFGPNGIEDVIANHSAEATAGIYKQSVTIGTKERVSLISGKSTRTNSGSLKGVVFNGF